MRELLRLIQQRWILLFLCILPFLIINFILFTSAEHEYTQDLASPLHSASQVAKDFTLKTSETGQGKNFELVLDLINVASKLSDFKEIHILLGTHGKTPKVLSGTLKISESSCLFELNQKRLYDNQRVSLVRKENCDFQPTSNQKAILNFHLKATKNLSLWMLNASPELPNNQNLGLSLETETERSYAIGLIKPSNEGPAVTRLQKLAYLWDLNNQTTMVIFVIEFFLAIWIGALFLIVAQSLDIFSLSRFKLILAAACLIVSSSALISIITPPMQAPDEPDHFLGYLHMTGQKDRVPELENLAKRTHFERLKFQQGQFFRTSDIDEPYHIAWANHVYRVRPEQRSSSIAFFWNYFHSVIGSEKSMAMTLLSIRLFNSILWTLCLVLPLILAALFAKESFFAFFKDTSLFLAIPVLAFFSMFVSDFSLTTTTAVASVLVLALLAKSRSVIFLAALFGLYIQICLTGNKAGAAILVLLLPLSWHALSCRYMDGSGMRVSLWLKIKDALMFWTITAVFAYLPIIPLQSIHMRTLLRDLRHLYTWLPELRDFITVEHYHRLALGVAGVGLGIYLLLLAFAYLYQRTMPARFSKTLAKCCKYILAVAALGTMIVPLYSLFAASLPHLQNIEVPVKPELIAYLKNILKVLLTSLRLRDFDFYLQSSFWGGFGWLDTMPATWYLALQNGLAIVLVILFLRFWRRQAPVYGFSMSGIWLCATLVLISLLAYFELHRGANLHGRYLIPVYVCNLGFLLIRPAARESSSLNWSILIYPLFWTYVFSLLLQRYLGS